LPRNTANRLLKNAVNLGILKEMELEKIRGKVYLCDKLIKILSY